MGRYIAQELGRDVSEMTYGYLTSEKVDMTSRCRSSLAGIRFRTHLMGWFMNKRPPK